MTDKVVKATKNSLPAIILGFFAWGMAFLCRTELPYLCPDLTSSQLGTANLVMVVCVFFTAIIFNRIADKTNKHALVMFITLIILAVGQLIFSLSEGYGALLFSRALIGVGAGPVFAMAAAICNKTCPPKQFAFACAWVCNGEAVLASFIGPSLLVALLGVMTWQTVGIVLAIPVIVVGVLYLVVMGKKLSNPELTSANVPGADAALADKNEGPKVSGFKVIFTNRNALLCLVLGILTMVGLWSVLLYAPDYWMSIAGASDVKMGLLMSGMGLAYIIWNIVLSLLSNVIGRKPVCAIFSILNAIALIVMFFAPMSGFTQVLFVAFSGLASALSVFYFTTIPMETLGDENAGTAGGIINGASDLVGAALIPWILGMVAETSGVTMIFLISGICMAAACVISLALKESAPGVLDKRAQKRAVK